MLNQTELFDDLFVFIDAPKKQMFEVIDGRHSIAEIVAKVSGDHSRAAQLFDKLWWYDQVVFDTSNLA